jgi:hypothetical protein
MADQNIAEKPQTKPGQQPEDKQPNRPMGQQPDAGKDSTKSPDQGLVGQDTDGDGKVVKPGQKPGQSHGEGLDK